MKLVQLVLNGFDLLLKMGNGGLYQWEQVGGGGLEFGLFGCFLAFQAVLVSCQFLQFCLCFGGFLPQSGF